MEIDAIQQGPRQLARISLDLARRTFTGVALISKKSTGATVQITTWV